MPISAVDLLKKLLAEKSITPDDGDCQKIIADELSALGFKCEHLRFGDVDNLWARIGTEKPLLVFAGHTDVVPTGPVHEWTSPPFTPTERNGYLYARGACDMKGAIAPMVVATTLFLKKHPDFKGSIAFLLTSDEEGPSINGTKKVIELLEQRGEKIDYCIIGEPSSDKELADQIRVGRRGSLHAKLTIQGKQGHVAHPHLAINPIHRCLLALNELVETKWDNGNEHFPPTTLQISNIHAGTGALNVIPGDIGITFNFRHGTASTVSDLQNKTEAIFKKYDLKFNIDWTIGAQPFLNKHGNLLAATQAAITAFTGKPARESTGGGTSDGRFIAPTGAELIELGVIHATAHQIDECVAIDDIVHLTKIYEEILTRLLG